MLDADDVRRLVSDMWRLQLTERVHLDNIYDYVLGRRGAPKVPEGAGDELIDLARLAVKNVLPLIRDSFVQNLSVIGFRDALAKENKPAWKTWQANRMDGRQVEVYRPAVTYGAAYVVVTKDPELGTKWRPRSPRQLMAVYEDPQTDLWPQYAFEMWVDQTDAKPTRKAVVYDDQFMYPMDLGWVPANAITVDPNQIDFARALGSITLGEPIRHGASNCPVVRFINARDADDLIVGEVSPLLGLQRALNSVNFDRLIVSRFGAFPQKVITGWSGEESEVLKASAKRVWSFEDPDVKAQSFPAANIDQYNNILKDMLEFIALTAQVSPAQFNSNLTRVSPDALAASEANQQRKTESKREAFGESWEQVFRLSGEIVGDTETANDESSEVVWKDTEARSFAAVVDGITKLAQVGVPIDELVDLAPGLSQQKIQSVKDAIRRGQANALVQALTASSAPSSGPGAAPPKPGQMANPPLVRANGQVKGAGSQ